MGCSHNQEGQQEAVCGSSKEKEEEGKIGREERRREREERKGGREERKGERKEEKRRRKGRKRGKRKRKRKECCAVRRPGRQRTLNCATRGRFPPTLVIFMCNGLRVSSGFPGEFVCYVVCL